jgi:hypothetical protein
MRKTNPIWPRRTRGAPTGVSGAKSQVSSQEGPPARPLTSHFKPQTSHFPTANCAKRSQTWGDWGVWAKAVVVWGVARPGSETCKTNPILKCQVSSLKFQVSGRKEKEYVPRALTSNFKPHTSHSPPTASGGGVAGKTKPISTAGGRSRAGTPNHKEPKRAKRTQFRAGRLASCGETCKTNPILPERPGMGAGWWAAMSRRSAIVQNEANLRAGGPTIAD